MYAGRLIHDTFVKVVTIRCIQLPEEGDESEINWGSLDTF